VPALRVTHAVTRYATIEPLTEPWPSQWEAVHFGERHERERVHDVSGGIIADEMGLGKTFQWLLLILRHLQARCAATGAPFGQPTLIVCPKTLLPTWRAEMVKHFPRDAFALLVLAEGANQRATPAQILTQYTVVLTTYPTLVAAHRARAAAAPYAALFALSWWRIIADESHVFANRDTTRFDVMCRLRAHHKWILTGTPVLNDVGDARALLRFLGVPEARLPVDQSARSERVSGTLAADRSEERKARLGHVRDSFAYLLAMRSMLHEVMLRRTDGRDRYRKQVQLAEFETGAERDLYAAYHARFRANCRAVRSARAREEGEVRSSDGEGDSDASSGTDEPVAKRRYDTRGRRGMKTLTVDILRMRQICVCPYVVGDLILPPHLLLESGYPAERRAAANTTARILQHAPAGLHSLAYLAAARVATDLVRPMDFLHATPAGAAPVYLTWVARAVGAERWARFVRDRATHERLAAILAHVGARVLPLVSTKMRLFLRHFRDEIPGDDKYLVFSEWVNVLSRLEHAFSAAGYPSFMLTGDQTSAERDLVLRTYEKSTTRRVLFVSLHVGGNGLNIACANHVSVADPWWNPQTELQAIYRMIRPAQEKYGHVFNVIMRGTVEEDVNRMASEKEQITRLLLDTDAQTLRTIADTRARLEAGCDDPCRGDALDGVAAVLASRGAAHAARSAMLELVDRVLDEA
jgi:SNF2 family DNA or RNA helicase